MYYKLLVWMLDQPMRDLIVSELTNAGYDVHLMTNQMLSPAKSGLENWGLLILDMEVLRQTDNAVPLLQKLRKLSGCKVLLLTKREFYSLIRENELKTDELTEHILFFPLDRQELVENVKRYFKS